MKDTNRMKQSMLKTVSLTGCLSFLLFACTSGEEDISGVGTSKPLEITAVIDQQTRAAGTEPTVTAGNYDKRTFAENDLIKITGNGENAEYYYNGTRWLPVSTVLTTAGSETFKASYPVSFNGIQADQTDYKKFWLSNNLTAETTVTGNLAEFTFAPAASKITIVIEYTAERTGESVKVKGATVLTDNGTATEEITLLGLATTGVKHTYTGIINPGSKSFTITVATKDNTAQSFTQNTKELLSKHNYIYNFSSTSNLILNSVTVENFVSNTEISGGDAT